jgi:chloramphenicol 3-O phosphotransferase
MARRALAKPALRAPFRNWMIVSGSTSAWMGISGALPDTLKPGIGLRPGGERPDLEDLIPTLYAGLFDSIAANVRLGFNVVADLGIHDRYSRPLGIWRAYSRCFEGFDRLLVGVHCSLKETLRRRNLDPANYIGASPDGSVPEIISVWQDAVHQDVVYDLELWTNLLSPAQCANAIMTKLEQARRASS